MYPNYINSMNDVFLGILIVICVFSLPLIHQSGFHINFCLKKKIFLCLEK